jgi:site-specific DNA-methyltransferase (adenine-specific)
MKQPLLNSSLNEDWPTNQDWFNTWNEEFFFTLDAAANDINHKCDKYYTIKTDGLAHSWKNERVFINPPYNNLYDWVEKAHNEWHVNGVFSVMFMPVRTQNNYWHDFVWDDKIHRFRPGVAVRFLRRMKFTDSAGECPFGLMLLIHNPL